MIDPQEEEPRVSADPIVLGSGVPAAGEDGRRRWSRWRIVGTILGVLIAIAVLGGFTYRVPYVALVPGSARDTEPLVEIDGVEEFPSDGELLFTTVRLRGNPNLWEYLWLTNDDDVLVIDEKDFYGDRTPDENREFNLQAMTDSKQTAIAVALEELGYEAINPDGVFVVQIVEDTPAESVLELGDVILAVDGQQTLTDLELVDRLAQYEAGDTIELDLQRFATGDAETISIELAPRPDGTPGGFLGIAPQTRVALVDGAPFEVDIDSGEVGGPSAGLAFTLAVLDQLTEGELTGGIDVAVTGSMSPDGRIGSVGGVPQKAAAVRDLGIEVFIVPEAIGEAELELVRLRAGDNLDIRPVATLEDALEVLESLGGNTEAIEEFASANL